MQAALKMIKKILFNKKLQVISTILLFILFLLVCIARITNFRSERMDINFFIFLILAIFSFYLFKYLDNLLKKEYYNQNVHSIRLISGGYTFITLTHPKRYFRKKKLWNGYLIYLLSRITIFVFIYLIIKLILNLI